MWTDPFCAELSWEIKISSSGLMTDFAVTLLSLQPAVPVLALSLLDQHTFSMVMGLSAKRNFSAVLVECAAAQPAVPAARGVCRVGAALALQGKPQSGW